MEEHETKLAHRTWRSSLPSMSSRCLWVFFFLLGVFHRRRIRCVVVYPLSAYRTHIRQHFVGGTGAVRQSRVGITSTCRRLRAECAATLAHASSVPKATRMVSCHLCWKWDVGINQLSLTRSPALKPSLWILLIPRRLASWMARKRSCGMA